MNKILFPILTLTLALAAAAFQGATIIVSSGSLPSTCVVGNIYIKTGTGTGFYACLATNTWTGPYGTGGGDVTSAANITDNAIVRGDGGAKGIQESLISIDDSGALTLPDGVKQVFNPNGTNAGINIGSQGGDPSSLSNGDIWYNSSSNKFRCRENGATTDCIGTGGGTVGDILDERIIVKASDETVSASTSLQSDDELLLSIAASETWLFEFTLAVEGNNATDFKFAINVPSGATGRQFALCNNTSASTFSSDLQTASGTTLDDTAVFNCASPGVGNNNVHLLRVYVVNSSNSGNVTLRWACVNASNSVIVKAGSLLHAWRVN